MIAVVAGARPNLVKVAPILRELEKRSIPHSFIWAGQHSGALDMRFELGMPTPHHEVSLIDHKPTEFLEVITAKLVRFWARAALLPKAVVVVGDVTTTLAAALAATAHGIPVVHVEAGLRSGDWEMPEERNRAIVDELSDLLLTTEARAVDNLCAAGLPRHRGGRIVPIGNVMIDSLRWAEAKIAEDGGQPDDTEPYALVTIHRPSNVDDYDSWARTLRAVDAIREHLAIVWPLHPRVTAHMAQSIVSGQWLTRDKDKLPGPRPYREMVRLMKGATLVATDSGGVQEETTALGIPCLTLRENTERPITVTEGTNTVVGLEPDRIGIEVAKITAGYGKKGRIPEGWDGHAAERIVDAIQRRYL